MNPVTTRGKDSEDQDEGVYEQEYVPEEDFSVDEESHVDYDDTLTFGGDYAEGEDSEYSDDDDDDDDDNGVEEGAEDEQMQDLGENVASEDIVEDQNQELQEHHEGHKHEKVGILTNLEWLDCPICCHPLDVPVYQCENGHAACSSCRSKINNICPYCRCLIDLKHRIRLIEDALDSVLVKCRNTEYGCKEMMYYKKKYEHETTCRCEPCPCPLSGCEFTGSSTQLYKHFTVKHIDSAVEFSFNSNFQMILCGGDKSSFSILREERDGILFVLSNSLKSYGNAISISCIVSKSDELLLDYSIRAWDWTRTHSQTFESVTPSCRKLHQKPSSTGFLLVPSYFFGYTGQLQLDICIGRSEECSKFRKGSKLLLREAPAILDGSGKEKAQPRDVSKATMAPKVGFSYLSPKHNPIVSEVPGFGS